MNKNQIQSQIILSHEQEVQKDVESVSIIDVCNYLKDEIEDQMKEESITLTGVEAKQYMKEFPYKVGGYKTKLNPRTKKFEKVQTQIWAKTEVFVSDLQGEARKSADEDIQVQDEEEYLQMTMPKIYWEALLKFLENSITQDDVSQIIQKVKTNDIPITNFQKSTQEKINFILKNKKQQYTIIIPIKEANNLTGEQIAKKYKIRLYRAKIQQKTDLDEYWITAKSIESYFFLLLQISKDIKNTHPDVRTKTFVDDICQLHLNMSVDEIQLQALEHAQNQQDKLKSDMLLGKGQLKIIKGNNKTVSSNKSITPPIENTFNTFQDDEIQLGKKMDTTALLDCEASNAIESTEIGDNTEKIIGNEEKETIQIQIQDQAIVTDQALNDNYCESETLQENLQKQASKQLFSLQQQKQPLFDPRDDEEESEEVKFCPIEELKLNKKIEEIKQLTYSDGFCKEAQTIKNICIYQQTLEKIKASPYRYDYDRGQGIKKKFNWVYDIHSSIYNDLKLLLVKYPENVGMGKTGRKRIKDRMKDNFPQKYFPPYLNLYEKELCCFFKKQ